MIPESQYLKDNHTFLIVTLYFRDMQCYEPRVTLIGESHLPLIPDLKVHQLKNNHLLLLSQQTCDFLRSLLSLSVNDSSNHFSHVSLVPLTSSQAHSPRCILSSVCAEPSPLIFFLPHPPMTGTLALHFLTPDTTL